MSSSILALIVIAAIATVSMLAIEVIAWIIVGVTGTLLAQAIQGRREQKQKQKQIELPKARAVRYSSRRSPPEDGSGVVSGALGDRIVSRRQQAIRVIDATCIEVRA
jgi:hypothetical protein